MPNIKSAIKRSKQSQKAYYRNLTVKRKIKATLKNIKKSESSEENTAKLQQVYSVMDKSAKKKVIHKNKAARLKSRAAKQLIAKT